MVLLVRTPGKTLPPNQGGQHDVARDQPHPSLEDPWPSRPLSSSRRSSRPVPLPRRPRSHRPLHRRQSRGSARPRLSLDRGKFTTIDHPDAVLETAPYGINNRGQIVGGYDTAGFAVHGFLLDRGRYTTIDVPGASRTIALRINARGQILGDYEDARGGCHGFLLDKGRFTTIDVPGAPTQALGLNDRGQVVGTYIDAGGAFHGFLLDKGVYTTIDVPGALQSTAADINARGQTIGFYLDAAGTTRVYLRAANGSLTTIAFPGAVATVPFGINNRGDVVGFYMDANQVRHGFLFKNGAYTRIDHPLASSDTQAHDLNDRGQIVGLYERVAGQAVEARGCQSKQERPDPRGSHRVCPHPSRHGGRYPERRASSDRIAGAAGPSAPVSRPDAGMLLSGQPLVVRTIEVPLAPLVRGAGRPPTPCSARALLRPTGSRPSSGSTHGSSCCRSSAGPATRRRLRAPWWVRAR